MAKERIVNTRFWADSYVSNLDSTEKLLFLYLITNQYTEISGVYELPLKYMALDTGIEKEMVEKILKRFENDKKIKYFNGWVYVLNFSKYQKDNPKVKIGINHALKRVPQNILDSLCIVYDNLSHSNSNSNLNPNPNSNSKDIAVSKTETALRKEIVSESHTRAIEIFCNYYELKTGLKYNFIAKDAKQIQILLKRLVKILTKDLTAENLLNGLQYFLNNIQDDWILNNLSISTINSKFNEILNQMKNGIRKTNGRGFASDSPEKWQRIFSSIAAGNL